MISGDPNILDSNSVVGKRIEEYRKVLGELEILLCKSNFFNFFSGFIKGCKLLYRKKVDIITAQSPEHWLLAWIFSKIFKIPWQMQIHTDIFSLHFVRSSVSDKMRVFLAKFLIPRADGIRVVSERIKKSIQELWTMDHKLWNKIVVLPIFVDVEKIKRFSIKTDLHEKYGKDKFIILMASRLTKEKNVGLAIDVFKDLLDSNSSPQPSSLTLREEGGDEMKSHREEGVTPILLIVGNGPEEKKLKLKTMNYKLRTNVIFESWTDDLFSYYKTCDLFLLTSNYEGYGMALVEAAASGARIISSDVGVAREILENEAVFKIGDALDLKNKLNVAFLGALPKPKQILQGSKEIYLTKFKRIFELCK